MTWTQREQPLDGTRLTREQLLPDVVLTEAQTGQEWRPSLLRQRAAVVLCFLHADCQPCQDFLSRLAELADDIRWADAQVRVVLDEPGPSPFPVLVDRAGAARKRLLGPDAPRPVLVVADRYTAVAEAYPAGAHDFPEPREVFAAVRHMALRCPECSV